MQEKALAQEEENTLQYRLMEKVFREDTALEVKEQIEQAKRIAILSHRNPDGDTIGAGTGLYNMLQERGKYVELFCVDPVPSSFRFLKNAHAYNPRIDLKDVDLLITVDVATKSQTGLMEEKPQVFDGKLPIINIDHHISNEMFGAWNLVQGEGCSTTAVLTRMFQLYDWEISPTVATCLMLGLMTDTGSFQHSNTTPRALKTGAILLRSGADLQKIKKHVFYTNPVSTLRLWGRILRRMSISAEQVVMSAVYDEDFKKTGAQAKDIAGAIDYLNMVPRSRYCMLLTERDGKVKGSLRTQNDDVNLSDIAGAFGGGGHKKAAGFTTKGKLQVEQRFHIVEG